MSSCVSCGKHIGANVAFCPYCGTTSPSTTRTPDQRPIIRKNAPPAEQRNTPVSPRAEQRTVRYQVPSDSPKPPEEQRPEVPSADQGELHDNRTLRRKIAPPPTSGAAQSTLRGTAPPSSLKPESTQSESKKAVSAEEFRPTVRRMAPPSTGHKTPLRASVTDPRRSLETSSASSKAGDAEPAQPVESTAASAIEDSTPGPAVVQPDALVDPNQFADKTMAIQMTAEMLDDLERRAAGPKIELESGKAEPQALESAPKLQVEPGGEEQEMGATQAMEMTAEDLHRMNLAEVPVPAPPVSPVSQPVEVVSPQDKPVRAEAAAAPDPAAVLTAPSMEMPSVEANSGLDLPERPGSPESALQKLGSPQKGLMGSLRYFLRSTSFRASSHSALSTLKHRATLLDKAADAHARSTGLDAWNKNRFDAVDAATGQRLAASREEFQQLQIVLNHAEAEQAALMHSFEANNFQQIQAMEQSQALRDDFHRQLKAAESQLTDIQSQLAKESPIAASGTENQQPSPTEAGSSEQIAGLVEQKKQLLLQFNEADILAIQTRQVVERARNEFRAQENTATERVKAAEQAAEHMRAQMVEECTSLGRAILLGHPTGLANYPESVAEIQELIAVRQSDGALQVEWEAASQSFDTKAARRGKIIAFNGLGAIVVFVVMAVLAFSFVSGGSNQAARDVPDEARNDGTSSVSLGDRYLPEGLPFYAGVSLDGLKNSPILKEFGLEDEFKRALKGLGSSIEISAIVIGAGKRPAIVAAQTNLTGDDLESVFPDGAPAKPLKREFDRVYSDDETGRIVAFKEKWGSWVTKGEGSGFTDDAGVDDLVQSLDLDATAWGVASLDGVELVRQAIEAESGMAIIMPLTEDLQGLGFMFHAASAMHGRASLLYASSDSAELAHKQFDRLKSMADEQLKTMGKMLDEESQALAKSLLSNVIIVRNGRVVAIKIDVDAKTAKMLIKTAQMF